MSNKRKDFASLIRFTGIRLLLFISLFEMTAYAVMPTQAAADSSAVPIRQGDWLSGHLMLVIPIIVVVLVAVVLVWNIQLRRSVKAHTRTLQAELADHKKTETSLAESRRRLETLMDNLQGVAFRCANHPDWPMEFLSKGCRELTGYPPETFLGNKKPWNDLIDPSNRPAVWDEVQKALQQHQSYQIEYVITTRSGDRKWVWEKGCGVYHEAGELTAIEGFISDITQRKEIEQKLRAQEAKLASIFKSSPAGMGVSADRTFLDVNDRVCRMTGYTYEELVGRDARKLYLTQEDFDSVEQELKRQIRESGIGTVETTWHGKNGKKVDVSISATPVNRDDLSQGIIFNALDITEAKVIRQRVIAERDRAQQYLDIAGVMIVVLDAEGHIQLLNRKGCQILECTEGQVRGKDWLTTFVPASSRKQNRQTFCELITGVQDSKIEYYENTVITSSGQEKLIAWHSTIIRDEHGTIVGTLSSGMDVTAQRAAETTLQLTQFAVDRAGEMVLRIARDGSFCYVNDAAVDMLGYNRRELLEMSVFDVNLNYTPQSWPPHWKEMKAHENMRFESLLKTKDGRMFPVEITSSFFEYGSEEYLWAFIRDISERKAAEQTLQMTQFAMDHAGEGIFLINQDARFEYVNEAACASLGYTRRELLALGIPDVDPDFPMDQWEQHWKNLQAGQPHRAESRHRRKNGTVFPVEITSNRIHYKGQDLRLTFARDITEQKQARQMLQFTQFAVDHAGEAAFWMNAQGGLTYVNEAACRMLGYTRKELLGLKISDFDPNYPIDRWEEHWAQSREKGSYRIETQHRTKDGRLIPVEVSINFVCYEGVEYHCSFARDITERKAAERQLKLTQFAVDHAEEAVYLINEEAAFEYVNEGACRSLGYTRQELLTMGIQDIDPDFDQQAWQRIWASTRASQVGRAESRHRRKDGTIFPVEVTANHMVYEGRELDCVFVRDISERKQAEAAILESEKKHRLLFTEANDAIFIMDRERFIECNSKAVELYGCSSPEQLLDHSPLEFSPENQEDGRRSEDAVAAYIDAAYAGRPQRFAWVHCKRSGEPFYVEVSLTRMDFKGRALLQAIVRDMTEHRANERAREKLMSELQSKNEELEGIVFIASHDLRSPLVNIHGFTGELEKSLSRLQTLLADETLSPSARRQVKGLFDQEIPEAMGFINAGNRKMDMLLNGLLRLSRVGTAELSLSELDMKHLFEGIINNFRFRTRQKDIAITMDASIPACRGDAVLISQVFNNLVENAIKYRSPNRPAKIHIAAERKARTVVYSVRDNGIGIAPEHLNKVFEIFHRLNPDSGSGEGLGLTIVRRILKRQEGRAWIDSEPGIGTTVYVELPAS